MNSNLRLIRVVLLALGLLPAATASAVETSSYQSLDALSHYVMGTLLQACGEDQDAMTEFSQALAIDPKSAGAARQLSQLSARMGQLDQSLGYARQALRIEPEDARASWLEGNALLGLGRIPEAFGALDRATHADSEQVDYFRSLAQAAEQLDRIDRVAAAYRRIVFLDEDDGEAWFQLAAAEARLGHFGAADSALVEAVDINPLRPGLFFLQGWIQESTGRPKEAIELYRRHLGIHGADQNTRRRLVNLLVGQKRYPEAYTEAMAITRARPDDPEALEVEAELAFWTHRPTEAQKLLDRILQAAPDDADVAARVVGVLTRHERGKDAVTLAQTWEKAHAADYHGPLLVARARAMAGNAEQAIEPTRRAVAMAPDSLAPRVALGRLLQSRKRFAEAESLWTETARRFPDNSTVALDAAYCREQLGDLDGAIRLARDVVRREPQNAQALNFLGYLFADHNQNLAEAEDLIRRALEEEPDNGAFLDSMGWVYYRLGRLAEARTRLERAVGLTGGDPVVREHLGDVYKDLHLIELARDQYRRSLAADSANARVRSKLVEIR